MLLLWISESGNCFCQTSSFVFLWIFCGFCCPPIVPFPVLLGVQCLFFALKPVAVWYREQFFCCFIAWYWLSTYSWGISKWYFSGVPSLYGFFLCQFFLAPPTLIFAASSSWGSLYSFWTLAVCILGNCPEAEGHGASYFSFTLPVVQCLKSVASYILSGFIVAFEGRANSGRVSQSHLRVELNEL